MRTVFLVSAALLLVSCPKNNDSGESDTDVDTLPDPLEGLEQLDNCAEFQAGNPPQYVGAASAYLAGEYTRNGNDLTGFEYWHWIPNDCLALQDANWEQDTPCTFVWDIFAEVDENPDGCTTCLMQITGEAFTNEGASDCPTIGGFDDNAFTYNVRAGDNDGELRMFFTSGTEFASGLYNDGGIVWTGFGQCEAIGSSTGCN